MGGGGDMNRRQYNFTLEYTDAEGRTYVSEQAILKHRAFTMAHMLFRWGAKSVTINIADRGSTTKEIHFTEVLNHDLT